MGITLKTRMDKSSEILSNLKTLTKVDVLVGIPADTSGRTIGKGKEKQSNEKINNAELITYLSKGVRANSMIKDMNKDIEQGSSFKEAYSLYIASKGSPLWRIPPRPIIEPAITAEGNVERIAERLKTVAALLLDGKREEANVALHMTGLEAVNIIRAWFNDPRNNWPPLAAATKKAKGSEAILVDTAQMRNAITYILRIEGEK